MFQTESSRPPSKNGPEIASILLVSLVFGAMLGTSLLQNFSVYKLSLPFFVFSWILLLGIHEFGHALMALALGWKVDLVSIGTGRLIGKRAILGVTTEFRAIPLSGFALPRPCDLVHPRKKTFLIYAAGPGIELILVGFIFLVLGPSTLFQLKPEIGLIAAQSFCVAAVFGILICLVPLPCTSHRGETTWTDGLGMILCWQLPDDYFRGQIKK